MIWRDQLLSIPIDRGTAREMREAMLEMARSKTSGFVCFANVHMFHLASRRPKLHRALNASFLVAPDGMPLARALSSTGPAQERVDGMTVFPLLLLEAARQDIAVAFFGSDPATLEAVCAKAAKEIPQLRIVEAIAPPHSSLPFADDVDSVRRLEGSGAGLVFVALGCPKQELWMAKHSPEIPAVLLGVGNAFATWLGWEKRSPRWMRLGCLEWFGRLCQNPRRLWRRYLVSNTWFVLCVLPRLVLQRFFRKA